MTETLDGLSAFFESGSGLRSLIMDRMALVGGPLVAVYAWRRSADVIAVIAASESGILETAVAIQPPPGALNTVQTPWHVVVARLADTYNIATGETVLELRLSTSGEPEIVPFVEPDGDAWWALVKEVRARTSS